MNYTDENDYYFLKEDNKFHKFYSSCSKYSQKEFDEYNHNFVMNVYKNIILSIILIIVIIILI